MSWVNDITSYQLLTDMEVTPGASFFLNPHVQPPDPVLAFTYKYH
jgi:hypothetical protein